MAACPASAFVRPQVEALATLVSAVDVRAPLFADVRVSV